MDRMIDDKALEEEFKEFLKFKETDLPEYHDNMNEFFETYPSIQGTIIYTTAEEYIRAELHYKNGTVHYSSYENSNIVMYALLATYISMFMPEAMHTWGAMIIHGFDFGELFMDVVNELISTVQESSDNWDICIK